MSVTVVIPVERGQEHQWWLPEGTEYKLVAYDFPQERAAAIDQGVMDASTTFVLVLPHDAQLHEEDLAMLESCCWNDRAAYPSMCQVEDDRVVGYAQAEPWCPNRLQRENFIGPVAIVRRDSYLAAGGWGMGPWDLWMRLGRMRRVDSANVGLRSRAPDETVAPIRRVAEATFFNQASYPTTYYRCQLPARYLPGIVISGIPKAVEADGGFVYPGNEGTAVWQFPGDKIRHATIKKMQQQGIRCLVDVDDNYLDRYETQKRAGWVFKENDPASDHSVETHRAIVEQADGVIVTTDHLASRYRKVNPNVYVCPNQIDPADWPALEKPDDGVVRVGWFASQSHRNDAALITTTLKWLKEQSNVEIVLMGVGAHQVHTQTPEGEVVDVETKHWFPFLTKPGGAVYRYISVSTDMAVYWKLMMDVDIGLNPVTPDVWSSFRSDLKGLGYAMAGACPILPDVPAYKEWQSGKGCLKAGKPSEYLRRVKNLVRDPAKARELAAEAREYVLAERTVEKNAHRWLEAIRGEEAQRQKEKKKCPQYRGTGVTTQPIGAHR